MNSSSPKLSDEGLRMSTIMPLIYAMEAARKLSKYYLLYDQQNMEQKRYGY